MADTASQVNDPNAMSGKTFVWHEVYGPSSAKTIEFYTKALDFGTHSMSMEGMGTYNMLTRGGMPVCGVVSTDEMQMPGVPPHWATYISVEDVDEKISLIESLGGKKMMGPMDVPTVGRMALMQDPAGATFWIFRPMPQ